MKRCILIFGIAFTCVACNGKSVAETAAVSVIIHAPPPRIEGILDSWDVEYGKEQWKKWQGVESEEDILTGIIVEGLSEEAGDTEDIQIKVATLGENQWYLTASSQGFLGVDGEQHYVEASFFKPIDGNVDGEAEAGEGTYAGEVILDESGRTIYLPTMDEHRTYRRKSVTQDGKEYSVNIVTITGDIEINKDTILIQDGSGAHIIFTLVK
ncbi:MAG: hypothetical protein JW800_04980 [Candidatus Omnitrophica bacterium]|nr:hypothetical protein [Candidatus Omnitrophota bacterium]